MGNDSHVGAFLENVSHAEFDDILFFRDFPFFSVKQGILHHKDRVIVADRGFHQSLRIVSVGWANHFQTWVIGHHIFDGVRVCRADVGAAIGRTTDDDGHIHQTAGHVAAEGGVVKELVDCNVAERHKHHLNDWADAEHGCANREARERSLGDRGVDHALVAVFSPEAFGDFVGTVVFGDFFAHDADVFVALELLVECLLNSFAVSDKWHCMVKLRIKN